MSVRGNTTRQAWPVGECPRRPEGVLGRDPGYRAVTRVATVTARPVSPAGCPRCVAERRVARLSRATLLAGSLLMALGIVTCLGWFWLGGAKLAGVGIFAVGYLVALLAPLRHPIAPHTLPLAAAPLANYRTAPVECPRHPFTR